MSLCPPVATPIAAAAPTLLLPLLHPFPAPVVPLTFGNECQAADQNHLLSTSFRRLLSLECRDLLTFLRTQFAIYGELRRRMRCMERPPCHTRGTTTSEKAR